MAAAGDSDLYRDLMRFKPDGMTANAWAVKAGVSRTVWADMRRHGNPSRKTLEKLLAAADSSLAEFEALRLGSNPKASFGSGLHEPRGGTWRPAVLPPLPLRASALAGEWGDSASRIEATEISSEIPIERLSRPPALANDPDAYAVTIVGDSMWPRFRPGRRVAVSPRSPVAIGDDVVVKLKGDHGSSAGQLVLIKELVRRTNDFVELRQFNPGTTFNVDAADIEAIQRVVGELI